MKTKDMRKAVDEICRRRGPGDPDLIVRRVILRRDRWDKIVELTSSLSKKYEVNLIPSEVAAIVLAAGLDILEKEKPPCEKS